MNQMRDNFKYYYDFYLCAKDCNYSETSRKLNLSVSSLSRSVSILESLLKLKLVNTSNNGFELTKDGENIYKQLDELFDNLSSFNVNEINANIETVLNIGCTRNIADYFLSDYLNEFVKCYPNIKINIFTDSASNLNEFLINHKIDVLIDYIPSPLANKKYDLTVRPLLKCNTCFACSKKTYEKINDKISTLKDLEKYNLIIPGNSRRRQYLDDFLMTYNVIVNPIMEMPDSKLMAELVKENDFIGYFIEEEINNYDLKKIELKEKTPINSVGVIYAKNSMNHIASKFVNMLFEDNN